MSKELCGYEDTTSGEPCQLTASQDDGLCHHHTQTDARADGGRKSKFTEDRVSNILDAAEAGTTIEGCARAAGIHHSTLYQWLDEKEEFSEAFQRARSKGERELLDKVADKDPKFVLERSYEYIKTEKREVEQETTVKGDGFTIEFGDGSDS